MRKLKIGDRVESGKLGTPEHDTGTVVGVTVVGGEIVGALVFWDIAGETYDEDTSSLRLIEVPS